MLTIDIGHSGIKWGVWIDDELTLNGQCRNARKDLSVLFDECFYDVPEQESVWVANVAGEDFEYAIAGWIKKQWSIDPVFLRTKAEFAGVNHGYEHPAQHGVDRWAALIAARAIHKKPVCIIDAGTAVTIDLMDKNGNHLGGRILPGLEMMTSILLELTGGVADDVHTTEEFANNTLEAIDSGTQNMLRAALIEVCDTAKVKLGNKMIILLTGGLSEIILNYEEVPKMIHVPDLVLLGLKEAAKY